MIDYRFIQKIREEKGIPEETIEKDYLIELLLSYLERDNFFQKYFIFRGGTALKKVYFSDLRYSEDLDFVVSSLSSLTIFTKKFEQILEKVRRDFPVVLGQRFLFPQKGHLQLFVSYDVVPEIRLEKEVKVDIIEEDSIPPSRRRKLTFSFPDFTNLKAFLNTYDLESIVAEKIGRLLDVVDEPRDLWDLWYLLKVKIKIPVVKNVFKKKYGTDIYLPNLLGAIKKSNYEKNWDIRLKNQVPNLIEYSKIIVELETLIKDKLKNN
jgi:predicted nucleotidyltransferase component of viral defense system